MAKTAITFSLDIEAAGPIPGPWWMCSFGVCRTDDVTRGFSRELKPLVIPGFSQPDSPQALEVVAKGLPSVDWEAGDPPEVNAARVREHFQHAGIEPLQALQEMEEWLRAETGSNRPVIVASPVTFDFMWIYWYWWYLRREMPPFGFSGLDIRSYFMGMHGVGFMGTGKARYLKHYPNPYAHTHDPLEDARQQGQIWHDMTEARSAGRP